MTSLAVFNIVSESLDLLKFSSESAIKNAGIDFEYVIIVWEPSDEVIEYIESNGWLYNEYESRDEFSQIENLRNCFNKGFDKCFEIADWAAGINTDMAFFSNWLLNLWKFRDKESIINCRQIEPGNSIHEIRDFGEIGRNFNEVDFRIYCSSIIEDKLISEDEWKRRADSTPHLMHREVWNKYGPWNVKLNNPPADVDFFNRCKEGGIKNMKSLSSIVYHYGATEIRRRLWQRQ
jgi:hypothetical protein